MSCARLTQWPPQHSKPVPQATCAEQAGAHTPEPQTLPAAALEIALAMLALVVGAHAAAARAVALAAGDARELRRTILTGRAIVGCTGQARHAGVAVEIASPGTPLTLEITGARCARRIDCGIVGRVRASLAASLCIANRNVGRDVRRLLADSRREHPNQAWLHLCSSQGPSHRALRHPAAIRRCPLAPPAAL